MGTRLYINTNDEAVIETLAGVPAGSIAKLKEIEKPLTGYDRWAVVNDDPVLATISHYLTYGWGKFDMSLVGFDNYAGVAHGEIAVELWKTANGRDSYCEDQEVIREAIEEYGVSWS
jgi:hypothetical protein